MEIWSRNINWGMLYIGRTTKEKDLGVTFNADMKVSEQCGIAAFERKSNSRAN